ncbi:hypothetical protein [Acuticoccus sp.]|uniref:hypothetical protein n=1 Tax=Acuticoccus sp. TaxID=1904378 RepID=UPI003B5283DD
MAHTGNCSEKITREHWVSKTILDRIHGLKVQGLPGRKDEFVSVSPQSLTSKVLCDKHNSILSPLDEMAGRAFETLQKAALHVSAGHINRKKERWYILDGYALELWAIKVLSGLHFGGVMHTNGQPAYLTSEFEKVHAANILMGNGLQLGCGFYYPRLTAVDSTVSLQTIVNETGKLIGIRISILWFTFDCIISNANEAPYHYSKGSYRPCAVRLHYRDFSSIIVIAFDQVAVGNVMFDTRWDPRVVRMDLR